MNIPKNIFINKVRIVFNVHQLFEDTLSKTAVTQMKIFPPIVINLSTDEDDNWLSRWFDLENDIIHQTQTPANEPGYNNNLIYAKIIKYQQRQLNIYWRLSELSRSSVQHVCRVFIPSSASIISLLRDCRGKSDDLTTAKKTYNESCQVLTY